MTDSYTLSMIIDSRPAESGGKKTSAALLDVQKRANDADKAMRAFGTGQDLAAKASGGLQRALGGLLAGFGTAKVLGDFAKQSGILDTNLRKIAALQGLDRTAASLERINAALRGSGSGFFDRGDVSSAAVEASAANFDLADSLKVVAAAEGLAREAGEDLAKATGQVATATKALGLGAADAGRVAEILGRVADLNPDGIGSLVGTLQKVAPEARKATVGAEELGAAFQVLDDEGLSFLTSGRDITGILNAFVAPTKDADTALRSLGLTFDDVDLRTKSIGQAFIAFRDAGLDAARAAKIFGDGNSASALLLAQNADKLESVTEQFRKLEGATTGGGARNITEAIQALGNAYNDLLLSGRDAGGAQAVVGTLSVLREILDDISGKDDEISRTAQALEFLVAGFVAYKAIAIAAALATETFGIALASTPFGVAVAGFAALTAAVVAYRDESKKLEDVKVLGEGGAQLKRDSAASIASQLSFVGGKPEEIERLSAATQSAIDGLGKAAYDAARNANFVDGLVPADATQQILARASDVFAALRDEADQQAAGEVRSALEQAVINVLVGDDSGLNDKLKQRARDLIAAPVADAAAAAGAAAGQSVDQINAATAAQSRILDAIEATNKAAEEEKRQLDALSDVMKAQADLAFEQSIASLGDEAKEVARGIEEFRLKLVAAGVTGEEYARQLNAHANALQQIADASRRSRQLLEEETAAIAAAKAEHEEFVSTVERGFNTIDEMNRSLRIEAATIGMTSKEAAIYRKELDYAAAATAAYGGNAEAAAEDIARFNAELENVEAAKEAARQARDFAEALTGPAGDAIDTYVEKLFKGEQATLDFRDVLAEVGAGVFSNLVTKPITEKATAGIAGAFGGLFGSGSPAPTSTPTAGVLPIPAATNEMNVQAAVVNIAGGGIGGANGISGIGGNGGTGGIGGFGGGTPTDALPASFANFGATDSPAALQGLGALNATAGAANSASGGSVGGLGVASGALGTAVSGAQLGGIIQGGLTAGAATGATTAAAGATTGAAAGTAAGAGTGAAVGGAGAAAGATAGATAGTAAFPVVGTIIGLVLGALIGGYLSSYNGNVFDQAGVRPFYNGGIVDTYGTFSYANGTRRGSIGERGPEAIVPLGMTSDGQLGIRDAGGGRRRGGNTTINIYGVRDAASFRETAPQIEADQRAAERRRARRG